LFVYEASSQSANSLSKGTKLDIYTIDHKIGGGGSSLVYLADDSEGNQFWIQGVGTIDGKTITVSEAFFTRGASWGSGFNPTDVERVPWGSISLDFDGCNSATLSYNSVAKGDFGSGSLDMQRITSLAGLNCN